jgi:hypothetical protein
LERIVHETRGFHIERPVTSDRITKLGRVVALTIPIVLEKAIDDIEITSKGVLDDSRETHLVGNMVSSKNTITERHYLSKLGLSHFLELPTRLIGYSFHFLLSGLATQYSLLEELGGDRSCRRSEFSLSSLFNGYFGPITSPLHQNGCHISVVL